MGAEHGARLIFRRLVERVAPFYALWRREKTVSARLKATNADLRLELAKATATAAGWKSHHTLAVQQREEALRAAMVLTESDEAWLRSLGERPS